MIGLCVICIRFSCEAATIYGFQGVTSAVVTGRTLQYLVHLGNCESLNGPKADPEFEDIFGGHVTTWRSFNDREISEEPFIVFFDQKMLYDEKGRLVQVVREIEVWGNDTAIVKTILYSANYDQVMSLEHHRCTLSSESKQGNIEFQASETEPERLLSFDELLKALEGGRYVHFQAMTFICMGGREHSFSNFGGHIPNYEMKMEDGAVHGVRSAVQQIVHYDVRLDMHVRDVINIRLFDNRTVEIIDTRGGALYDNLVHVHVSYCTLETGMPGSTFNVFAS